MKKQRVQVVIIEKKAKNKLFSRQMHIVKVLKNCCVIEKYHVRRKDMENFIIGILEKYKKYCITIINKQKQIKNENCN